MALSTGQLVGATWAVRGQPQQTLVSRWVPRGVYVMERGVASFIETSPPHTHTQLCGSGLYILSATRPKIHDELLIIALYSNFFHKSQSFLFSTRCCLFCTVSSQKVGYWQQLSCPCYYIFLALGKVFKMQSIRVELSPQ